MRVFDSTSFPWVDSPLKTDYTYLNMENKELLAPPQQSSVETPAASGKAPVPAGFGERFLAYLIDSVPFVIGCYATLPHTLRITGEQYSYSIDLKWRLCWILVYVIYETVFTSGGRATAGKLFLGLRVRSKNGGNLGFGAAFLRTIGYFISAAPLNLGYITALFTPDNRALHDYIAGSRVVRVRPRSDFANGVIWSLSLGTLIFLSAVWYQQTFLRLSPSEQAAVASARRGLEKIAALEELYRRQYGFYTDDLGLLAALSGDVSSLREELLNVLDPDSLVIAADSERYVISGQAKDRRGTKVQVAGP